MKKFIYIAIMAFSLTSLTACSKTLKSENLGIEVTLPGTGWKTVTDDSESFVISKDSDMVSYTSTAVPDGYKMPTSEDDIAEILGDDIMEVSQFSDFTYETNDDGSQQSLYFKQTLTVGNSSSILINKYEIKDGKLVTAIATLTDANDENISEIEEIIKNTDLK